LNSLEYEKKYFNHRLYRDHASIYRGDYVKDISKIGRNLDKTIIIDNYAQNFSFQKENGILIKPFYGREDDDNALFDLIPILISKRLL